MDHNRRFGINKPTVVHETIDNEVIIIEFDSGNYYSLDKVGADVWNLIERGKPFGQIVEAISNLYRGSTEKVQNALSQLITELENENLVSAIKEMQPTDSQSSIHNDVAAPIADKEKPEFESPILQKYSDMQELLLLDPIHEVDERGWPTAKPGPSRE
jgi:hypothetical protein